MAKKKFVVRPGATFGPGRIYQAGDIVEMEEVAYPGFADKLAPLEEAAAPEAASTGDAAVEQEEESTASPTLTELLSAPVAKALTEAGLDTVDLVKAASDEKLLAVEGIGAKTLSYIREQVA